MTILSCMWIDSALQTGNAFAIIERSHRMTDSSFIDINTTFHAQLLP